MERPVCKFCAHRTFSVSNGREDDAGYWWCDKCGAIGYYNPDTFKTSWFAPYDKRIYGEPNMNKSLIRALKSTQ